ncbi:MAG: GNAT family N-acetyltransferase [Cellulophaga sp.]|uniref:GNAT family N-acetyltransferase n=1 Tax=unclassified Cellulophaga TaxID=2634405 RepID=UPI000C2C4B7C|nr:GNAT family N-acetyltransferase [Cellulophaga sp. RHA19]PKB44513.1 ribosomal protein S18 acetylase RimI-like enzyme [Cellulophaga sp. RHA19]
MENIEIRIAKLEDLETLKSFEQGVILAERPFDETLKPDPISYYSIEDLLKDPKTIVAVATLNNTLIGSAYATIREAKKHLKHSTYAYLGFMYVDPKQRGKGVNKSIIDFLFKWIKQQNTTEVRLDVYSENAAALRAYEKAGFKKHMVNMRMKI